jgi:hypothetical protein
MTGATGALGGVASSASVVAFQGVTMLAQNFSLYGQDTWKLTPRLTLTYGLRWEVNPALKGKDIASSPYPVQGIDNPATMTLGQKGAPLYATTYDNFAPRVGVAYQLRQNQKWLTILRGGFGVFYDLGDGIVGSYPSTFPFLQRRSLGSVPFPLSTAQASPVIFVSPPPVTSLFYAADPNLQLPKTYQWNFAVEQAIGSSQTLSATYVGAIGRRLLRNDTLFAPNSNFTNQVILARNTSTSDYHALQLQFQRRLSKGLQALGSYTWSHSIDIASSDSASAIPSSTFLRVSLDRASSDFDVRHSFSAALSYDVPTPFRQKVLRAILGGWSVDDLVIVRSAFPVNVAGLLVTAGGTQFTTRPNLITGIPLYLYGPQYAGGKIINNTPPTAAQVAATGCVAQTATNAKGAFCTPPTGTLGSLGRNALRGFAASQTNLAVRRQFHLTEHTGLQLRADFFNLFNHPNFGSPNGTLSSSLFGQSTQMLASSLGTGTSGGLNPLYQIGGPRSIQLAIRLSF